MFARLIWTNELDVIWLSQEEVKNIEKKILSNNWFYSQKLYTFMNVDWNNNSVTYKCLGIKIYILNESLYLLTYICRRFNWFDFHETLK